jgi:hypothetical protein
MDNATAPENRRGGLALGVILLGLACIVVGFGLLTWTPRDASVALAMATPQITPTLLPASVSHATRTVEPSATPTDALTPSRLPTLALLATPTNTPLPSPTPVRNPLVTPEGTSLALTIVHSNDTWGYTRPCG